MRGPEFLAGSGETHKERRWLRQGLPARIIEKNDSDLFFECTATLVGVEGEGRKEGGGWRRGSGGKTLKGRKREQEVVISVCQLTFKDSGERGRENKGRETGVQAITTPTSWG